MKKHLLTAFVLLVLTVGTMLSAKAQGNSNSQYPNDNALIGKAIAAYHQQCPNNYNGEIGGSVDTQAICFAGGFLKRVTLTPVVRCQHEPCPLVLVILLATVDFDCDGNVASVECH